jgi:catechol 2,3-dioxygenase-like lactoylglutathione lyase family enzyme
MNEKIISGIQQIGIGVSDVHEAWKWYHEFFGMDIRVFEENAVAGLMLPYTGGLPRRRHAALALNLQGGGGFEIWQYKDRVPEKASFEIAPGDLGIFAAKIKCRDIQATYQHFVEKGQNVTPLIKGPDQKENFFVQDPYGNWFQLVQSKQWFSKGKKHTGAVYGALIGVSDIEKARLVYSDILGYDTEVYDQTGQFSDLNGLKGGMETFRRVLLKRSAPVTGGFSKLLGPSQIELLQCTSRIPRKIFENRLWGDLGFIHLCYDINGMALLREECERKGFPFTVDSAESFDMGEAAGHFSYIEDPDGTLIEFVETHKVPILKKLGLYLNLRKRDPMKNLPDWMIKSMAINRVKTSNIGR